ncbi:MAG: hypothetical protein Q9226_009001, partial [Calogaya cf. arnoldii]
IDLFADVTFQAVGTMTWTLVEPGVYFIAATLPSLRPLIRHVFQGVDVSAMYKSLLDRYTQTFSRQKYSKDSTSDTQLNQIDRPTKTTAIDRVARSAGFVKIDEHKTSTSTES